MECWRGGVQMFLSNSLCRSYEEAQESPESDFVSIEKEQEAWMAYMS